MSPKPTLAALALCLCAAPLFAQQPTENVEVEPITCWWRTTAGGVRVGEPFSLVLTCSVLQTQAARVLLDESRLAPSVVQLPPFEVLKGARADDLTTPSRRFFQYAYMLRVIDENLFGVDVSLPALQLTYRVESRVVQGQPAEVMQGRDLSYALPPLAIRVLSLVPNSATDIREARVSTFEDVKRAALRGTVLRAIGMVLFASALLMVLALVLGRVRQRRAATPKTDRVPPPAIVLRGVRHELVAVQQQVRDAGWTVDLVARALAALRIASSYALGRPVNFSGGRETSASSASAVAEGQLAIAGQRGVATFVSAPITAGAFAESEGVHPELRDALVRFTAAHYGRAFRPDAPRLDELLEQGIGSVDRLAADHTWRAGTNAAVKRSLIGLRGRVWAR